jgi:hypothetical protein
MNAKTTLVKIGFAQGAVFAALAFAASAQAADLPASPSLELAPVAAATTGATAAGPPVEPAEATAAQVELPANTAFVVSATTQQDDLRREPARVISPTHAQQSPDRASSRSSWRQVPERVWFSAQYHAVTPQYHRRFVRRHIPVRITERHRDEPAPSCPSKLGLNVLQISGAECLVRLPILRSFSLQTASCRSVDSQYHPESPQYQGSSSCGASSATTVVSSTASSSAVSTVAQKRAGREVQAVRTSAIAHVQTRTAPRRRVHQPRRQPRAVVPATTRRTRVAAAAPATNAGPALSVVEATALGAFALVLLACGIAGAPLLRTRLQSRGLSGRPVGSKRRGAIRYRE